jgi:hypothetical protein
MSEKQWACPVVVESGQDFYANCGPEQFGSDDEELERLRIENRDLRAEVLRLSTKRHRAQRALVLWSTRAHSAERGLAGFVDTVAALRALAAVVESGVGGERWRTNLNATLEAAWTLLGVPPDERGGPELR